MTCLKEVLALSNRDTAMLSRAIGIAMVSDMKHKHGAVIYKNGRVLSWAPNVFRNDPSVIFDDDCQSEHAERKAIKGYRGDLRGATIAVARVNNHGKPMLSRPCDRCYRAIREAGIKRIIYT